MNNATKTDKTKKSPDLDSSYWHFLLTEGERPKSVYAFTQELGIEEADFRTGAIDVDDAVFCGTIEWFPIADDDFELVSGRKLNESFAVRANDS